MNPALPEGMVDTLYVQTDVFVGPGPPNEDSPPYGSRPSVGEHAHTIIEDAETATDEIIRDESAIEFAENTDFGESYLVVVIARMQSMPDLELDAITRTDDGLYIEVAVDHRGAVEDDDAMHSLLLRITDEQGDAPSTVTVDVEDPP